jgi:phage portal protein BeeE
MKSGYETRTVNKTDGKEKPTTVDAFENALKYQGSSAKKLKDDIIQQVTVFGNGFIRKRRNIRLDVIGYEVLDTRFMSIVTDDNLTPIRYQYQSPIQNSSIQTYPPEDIIHVKSNTDFDNPLFGMTVLETIVLDVMADDEANLSNYFFFQNDAIPSALYVLEKGMDDPTQKLVFEQIKQTMTGGHNKNKSIVSS